MVPTSEKLICFGGGDAEDGTPLEDRWDCPLIAAPRFRLLLLSARVSSSSDPSSSSSSEEDVITIASAAGFDFGAAGLIVAGLTVILL